MPDPKQSELSVIMGWRNQLQWCAPEVHSQGRSAMTAQVTISRAAPLPVVHELQGDVQIFALKKSDDVLQVVLLLGAHPKLLALNLCLDPLGALVTDELGDLLGVLLVDALLEG